MNAQILEDKIAIHPFWKGLDPDRLRLMQEIAITERFEAGQLVFKKGNRLIASV
jgi:hypothetical protein